MSRPFTANIPFTLSAAEEGAYVSGHLVFSGMYRGLWFPNSPLRTPDLRERFSDNFLAHLRHWASTTTVITNTERSEVLTLAYGLVDGNLFSDVSFQLTYLRLTIVKQLPHPERHTASEPNPTHHNYAESLISRVTSIADLDRAIAHLRDQFPTIMKDEYYGEGANGEIGKLIHRIRGQIIHGDRRIF